MARLLHRGQLARLMFAVAVLAAAGCSGPAAVVAADQHAASNARAHVIPEAIRHVVIIQMENRSFDHYFGTFPGANGFPLNAKGVPSLVCNPDPLNGRCLLPYHDTSTINYGGPHSPGSTAQDIDGGKFDGFIRSAESPANGDDPNPEEVMGYHTQAEIPYYWSLASQYTLADNFFAATSSWSTMAHLYAVSGWSAKCKSTDPASCVSDNEVAVKTDPPPIYAWTDMTWVLHQHGVSWGYFVYWGGAPHQKSDDDEYVSPFATYNTLGLWNPMPGFTDVGADGDTGNLQPGTSFDAKAASGTLPAVSWVIPPFTASDHPAADISRGQVWLQKVISTVQAGPDWPTTAIFVQWDEWGGFYDHVMPPVVDGLGYGFRVPMIIVSPLVKHGYVDHQLLSSDAELKLIEDLFCGSQRLDASDGRPDPRPDVRENYLPMGDLRNDFFIF